MKKHEMKNEMKWKKNEKAWNKMQFANCTAATVCSLL